VCRIAIQIVKNGRPVRNMVKCQIVQYDSILDIIGIGVSWECKDHVSFHGNRRRYGAVLSVTVGKMLTKCSDLDA
jgi:hypothetical protein